MDRKNKFIIKEVKLETATQEVKDAIGTVKEITKAVKLGTAAETELARAITDLENKKRKTELLSAETKMLSGFSVAVQDPTQKDGFSTVWLLGVIISIYILFMKK